MGKIEIEYYYANWHHSHESILDAYNKLQKKHEIGNESKNIVFKCLDVDSLENSDLEIESVPTIFLKKDGKILVQCFETDPERLEQLIENFIDSPTEKKEKKAENLPKQILEDACNEKVEVHPATKPTYETTPPNEQKSEQTTKSQNKKDKPEEPLWSTVVSDGVLASVCFYQAKELILNGGVWSSIALSVVGVAASFGSFRFGIFPPIKSIHEILSETGVSVSMPLLALSCFFDSPRNSFYFILPPYALLMLFGIFKRMEFKAYNEIAGTVGILSTLGYGLYHINSDFGPYLIAGSSTVAFFSTVVGISTTKRLLGVRRVDWFHYGLALGLSWISKGFLLKK